MSQPRLLAVLFSAGMRVFFLAAGVYAALAMAAWTGWLATGADAFLPATAAPPQLWHAHEMVFGYAAAVLAGFFLTAVPGWTGTPAARATMLAILAGLWLAGRLAVWWSAALPPGLVAVLDLAFLPTLGMKLAAQLIRRPQPRNLMFLGLIAIVWLGNLFMHLDWLGLWSDGAGRGARVGLIGVTAMIAVIGGRVIPGFTRNAMTKSGRETGLPATPARLDAAGIALPILLALLVAAGAPGWLVGAVALLAGLAQLLRLAGWRGFWTLGQPILWSLHVGFAMLGLGYVALAAAKMGWVEEIAALHLLGIGAIGGMTLAMMTRAALGHTGRALVVTRPIAWAYALVALAALTRFLGAHAGAWRDAATLASGAFWLAAFAVFVAVYWPILTRPRQSGNS